MGVLLPWLSLRTASVNLRLNLELSNPRLLKHTRASKRLSAALRNFNSNKMKTIRIKTACLSWPPSSKLRSRLTRSIEEAEEIAALNLAKFRKAQQDLEETEERSKLAGAT